MVYYNGLPVLIDVGSGTYTRRTFSGQRYDIWFNRSDYHNVPTINGKTQEPGRQYKATGIAYSSGDAYARLVLDISKAYPADAGVVSWKRTIRLNRGKSVQVSDVTALKGPGSFTQHLMTSYPADISRAGEVVIHYQTPSGEKRDFAVRYDPGKLEASVEKVPLVSVEDQGILSNWGDNIYRINFKTTQARKAGEYRYEITAKKTRNEGT